MDGEVLEDLKLTSQTAVGLARILQEGD